MKLALRIVAAGVRGARDHAPRLAELLARREAGATFYVNLGPHRRLGWLPGREVGGRAVDAMKRARDAGFELGVYGWDAVRWTTRVTPGNDVWVERSMRRACERFETLLGERPRTHAAPGWRMSRHAFRLTQRLGFLYCSDTQGRTPYIPMCEGELVACPQLPTTLPTIEALLARGGFTWDTVHHEVLRRTADAPAAGHVFSLEADRGTARLAPVLERLIDGWRILGHEICSLRALAESLDSKGLEHNMVEERPLAESAGSVAIQGAVFLPEDAEVARAMDSRNNAVATAAD
jgi:peptidoglycan/xylan/chitin deacetylase (PgdA/CDA1 family)